MKRRDENRVGETVTELFGNEDLDAQTALKLEALAALHERKVGALMKSISAQKEELAKLKAASRASSPKSSVTVSPMRFSSRRFEALSPRPRRAVEGMVVSRASRGAAKTTLPVQTLPTSPVKSSARQGAAQLVPQPFNSGPRDCCRSLLKSH